MVGPAEAVVAILKKPVARWDGTLHSNSKIDSEDQTSWVWRVEKVLVRRVKLMFVP